MKMITMTLTVCVFSPLVLAQSQKESTNNWPRWRGPLDNGVAPNGDPPTTWSEKQNIRWKIQIPGHGLSTPVIWGDHVYVQTAINNSTDAAEADEHKEQGRGFFGGTKTPTNMYRFSLLAINRNTGKTDWQFATRAMQPHEGHHQDASLASASPVTDGEHILAFFGSRGLYCLNRKGKLLWETDLGDMTTRRGFGEGSSPALYGDTVVINWDHEGDSFIVALDKRTGKERWRKPRNEVTSWSTPIVVTHDDRPQIVVSATERVRGYDINSGEVIWECGGQTANTIPSPVFGHGNIYAMSGFRGNALRVIRLAEAKGDVTDSAAVTWRYDKDTPYVPSPLLYDDALYFLKHNRSILTCLNAKTGEPFYARQRIEGIDGVYASPVGAAGRVYIVGRNGQTAVLRKGPKYEVMAKNSLDESFDASPAIAGKELYLRGQKYLYCIAEP